MFICYYHSEDEEEGAITGPDGEKVEDKKEEKQPEEAAKEVSVSLSSPSDVDQDHMLCMH